MTKRKEYSEKTLAAVAQMKELSKGGKKVSLKEKKTTHFFRQRQKKKKLNLLAFNQIIEIDTKEKIAEVEGLVNYYDLTDATLPLGFIPEVTPELRAITVGGAISGLGVEATGFRFGFVHNTVIEFDVLTADGKVLTCSESENQDLFYAVPNSLGTLGYVLKATVQLIPIKKYVHVRLERFSSSEAYFEKLERLCNEKNEAEFIDGVVFSNNDFVILAGYFVDEIPKHEKLFNPLFAPYYVELAKPECSNLYFTIKDYLWRWDYDCFWATGRKIPFMGKLLLNPLFRRLFGTYILRSDRMLTLRHKIDAINASPFAFWASRYELLVQDVGVPMNKCAEFFRWYDEKVQMYPLWICPMKAQRPEGTYPLSSWKGKIIVDIGFYSEKQLPKGAPKNYYNRQVEEELNKLHGTKGLYSTSFYTKEEFWKLFDHQRYLAVKEKYDPGNIFPDLYEKAVGFKTL